MPSQSSNDASDRGGRPLHVVHVCRTGWPHVGGMESVVGGLASGLVAAGHVSRVVTLDHGPDGQVLPPGVWGGVVYARVPRIGPRRYPLGWRLEPHLRGADVVHVHGLDGLLHQVLAARADHGARVGVTPHGGFLHTPRHRLIKQIWLRTGMAAALRACDAVWYTSVSDQHNLEPAGVPGSVMQDGVDLAPLLELRRQPEAGRWLVFGRIDVHKGLDDLIDRLAAVAQHDRRGFRLRVVGHEAHPGLIAALEARARRLGIQHRITFEGSVDAVSLRQELTRCELAFFPSRHEGFGLAVVEAMAAGVPVLVNDIPAHRELVDDGVTGHVVDFARSDAGRTIRRVRGTLAPLGVQAREAARRHDWRQRVPAWVAAYRALLEDS